MKFPDNLLTSRQKMKVERLLIDAGIKECSHDYSVEDFCLCCLQKVTIKKGA